MDPLSSFLYGQLLIWHPSQIKEILANPEAFAAVAAAAAPSGDAAPAAEEAPAAKEEDEEESEGDMVRDFPSDGGILLLTFYCFRASVCSTRCYPTLSCYVSYLTQYTCAVGVLHCCSPY